MSDAAETKFRRMTEAPVKPLIVRLALPTMTTMMITSIYNMADTFWIGRMNNNSATAAVGVSVSLMALLQGVGFMLGMGSGNYIARLLGRQDQEQAEKVAATGFFTALGLGGVLAVLGMLFLNPLVRALGATDTILPYARDYVRYILWGAPVFCASLVMNNQLRMQGSAFYAMLGMCSGGLINIVLDPLFIFTFGMGTGGAALATVISQCFSFAILLRNCYVGGNIRIRLRNFMPKWEVYRNILAGGLPSLYRQGLNSLATICLNLSAGPYGDAAIAAMSVVTRILMFATSAMLGFGQGFQPVCGFNYGAKKYGRVWEAFWFCVRVSTIFLVLAAAAAFAFAPRLIAVFRDDAEVIAIGAKAMRLMAFSYWLSAWIIMANMLMQTIGKYARASLLALARQGLFFIPAILILPRLFGLLGVQMSQAIADLFSFLLSVPVAYGVLREMKRDMEREKADVEQPELEVVRG